MQHDCGAGTKEWQRHRRAFYYMLIANLAWPNSWHFSLHRECKGTGGLSVADSVKNPTVQANQSRPLNSFAPTGPSALACNRYTHLQMSRCQERTSSSSSSRAAVAGSDLLWNTPGQESVTRAIEDEGQADQMAAEGAAATNVVLGMKCVRSFKMNFFELCVSI